MAEGAVVRDSDILNNSIDGHNSVIDRSILDKEVVVEAGCHVGFGDEFHANRKNPQVLNTGLTIIGKRAEIPSELKIGRNCIIYSNVVGSDFPSPEVPSGETIRPKR